MALSHHKKELEKKYIVACPEWDITKLLMEKKETYLLAESVSVPVARMITPISVSDLEKYVKEIKFPCLIKPSLSHIFYRDFGTKVIKVKNFDELLLIYKKVNELGHEIMIQEYIPGDATCGVNYNSYFWDNEPLVEFTAKQIRNAPPDFGSPCVVKSHSFPEILELGRTVLKAMGFYGYSCIEFKKDIRDSSYKLMDVNGRHNLSSLLSVQCDLNFPALQYRHLVFGERPTGQDFQQDIYWIDLTRDIYYHALKSSVSLKEFLKPYLSKHVFAILNSKDLRPFLKRCIVQIKDYLTKTK